MSLKKIRNKVLQEAKVHVLKSGWNESLILTISKTSNFKYDEIKVLFPEGYKQILQMYLDEINNNMSKESQKINFIRLRVHERIRELIILRLKIFLKDKKLIHKTFLFLLLPHHYKLSSKNLYKTVDQMWFIAGDNSTDFNFYSKRVILASIYTTVITHFINNDNIDETILFLTKQLKKVSKIPKIKNKVSDLVNFIPQIFKLGKSFSFFKQ